ncbi:MAG: tRNA (adenosine(37)-N6)-threonylcarbamoyltransferase complex transferase subunit TsaD [Patescibacteria group bacterium]
MKILGIETSCDETAASIIDCKNGKINIFSHVVSSQVKLHAKWGGVVPNLAAREHLKNIIPVLKLSLKEASVKPDDLDLIAVTNGPGLIPALLIGTNVAKTLSYVWEKPLIGIHHIEGHIYANFINEISGISNNQFPILALVVSGGHTQLIYMKKNMSYEIIGQTLDDAVGEAFDKVARILDIGYPGGPAIAQWAKDYKLQTTSCKLNLPRPMINKNNFDFSFSGLKTAVLYETIKNKKMLKNKKNIFELCHEFQQAVIDVLVSKTIKAAKKYNPKTIMLAGGVAANKELRKQLGEAIKKNLPATTYKLPPIKYTGDNAAMIAVAAYFRWNKMAKAQKKKAFQNWKTLETDANLKLK